MYKLLWACFVFVFLISCAGSIEKNPIDDDTPPQLLNFSPQESSVNQPINSRFELVFDDPIKPETLHDKVFFVIDVALGTKVSGQNFYLTDDQKCIRLYLDQNLEANKLYKVVIEKGPNNLANFVYSGKTWTFRTGSSLTNYPPDVTTVHIGAQASTKTVDFGTVNVAPNTVGNQPQVVIHQFEIKNTSLRTINLTGSPLVSFVANSSDFVIVQPPKSEIKPSEKIKFTVSFSPTTSGQKSAILRILTDDPNNSEFQIALKGNANIPNLRGEIKKGDFNGDGQVDVAIIEEDNALCTLLSRPDGSYAFHRYSPTPSYQMIGAGKWFTGDFNGDGKTDLVHVVFSGSPSPNYMHPWLSNGDGTFDVKKYTPSVEYNMSVGEWQTGDFDGDGKTDLIHFTPQNYVHVHYARLDGQFLVSPPFSPGPGYLILNTGQWVVGRFNNDSMSDLSHIVTKNVIPANYMHPWLSNGTNGSFALQVYNPSPVYEMGLGSWIAFDFNNDSYDDLVYLKSGNTVITHMATGTGTFSSAESYSPSPDYETTGTGYWLVDDFNGDNKKDMLHIVTTGSNYIHPWISNGDGSFTVIRFDVDKQCTVARGMWVSGNVDGNSSADLIHVENGLVYHILRSNGDGTFSVQKHLIN